MKTISLLSLIIAVVLGLSMTAKQALANQCSMSSLVTEKCKAVSCDVQATCPKGCNVRGTKYMYKKLKGDCDGFSNCSYKGAPVQCVKWDDPFKKCSTAQIKTNASKCNRNTCGVKLRCSKDCSDPQMQLAEMTFSSVCKAGQCDTSSPRPFSCKPDQCKPRMAVVKSETRCTKRFDACTVTWKCTDGNCSPSERTSKGQCGVSS
jgi:hypothetical protein